MFEEGSVDPVYQARARVLNAALQEIGMGKYQWWLFVVAGFGLLADSCWSLIGGLILSPVVNEFQFNTPFLALAQNIGVLVGASFWGFSYDIWGRRLLFNTTLLVAGVFGLAAGGSPNLITLASLLAVTGLGVGGNNAIDLAMFLDFVPGTHQYLLTVMSIWWSMGQLVSALIAWPLISSFSCPQGSTTCTRADDMGWRYLLFAFGGTALLFWAIRFFVFPLEESPRFLIGLGRDAEAVAVVQRIAAFNGRGCRLTVDELTRAGEAAAASPQAKSTKSGSKRQVSSKSSVFTTKHFKSLFETPKLAWSTSLQIAVWSIVGLSSTLYNGFLPFLLASRGAQFGDSSYYITYRNQVILGVIGVPGALLAGWAVEQPYMGRKGTLALSAGLTGVFLFASTTARSSDALLGWNCGYTFNNNIMSSVLYAISPELFPAKDRGAGIALVATATNVFGVLGPVIALYANLETAVPVYISGGLIIGSGVLTLLLPYEPRGKASI
ncbi:MFS general substrate transporter [Dichomitus squalens LYAD-421 SS1]|uniref:MFS general substrate transporter n=1 Tax=Dichomitus squalens (strain LYAD-421) TaxID=732165 RepID=R7SX22_DICSQ|nr:MFS general substrate transporter [Dichomitus squalens LYAD-421 SS1]EJF60265.1 MFS general substrate transporter [Dichomitus squalens LYAD-421 SS1]